MKRGIFNRLGIKALGAVLLSFYLTFFLYAKLIDGFTFLFGKEIEYMDFLGKNQFFLVVPLVVMIGLFILIFFLLVNTRMRYFKYIIHKVKGIDSVEFLEELQVKGNDEFTELAKSINVMNKRIQDRFSKEKEIEESKNELITLVSHDLKTPLTSMIGYLELLSREKEDDEVRNRYIEVAYNKSLRLNTLVNELFEYTRLSGSDIEMDKRRLNLSNLVNQVVGESILDFEEKNIEVELLNPYKELYYEIDAKLFTRMLENMVRNAEKYSDQDSVFRTIIEQDADEIRISFVNRCAGVKEEELPRIFDKFYREDKARSSENEGTGLGLTIAKRIVELHNGKLTAEKEGDNIKFIVSLRK